VAGGAINVNGVPDQAGTRGRTVEQRPSDSARGVAALRFLGTLEEREEIRGRDGLAGAFLADEVRAALSDSAKRSWFRNEAFPPGTYPFILARTAWFDGLVEGALRSRVPQVVFLGAGYDSRPYRFADLIEGTRIFEIDTPPTQELKRSLLARAAITIPPSVTFVPIDLARDSLTDALLAAGFDTKRKALYVWEGVTPYLPAEAVDATLEFVRTHSPAGSTLGFDCICTFPGADEAYGVKEHREFMKRHLGGEPVLFRIDRGEIAAFLATRGFQLAEHLGPEDMERRYLTLKDGAVAGRVTADSSLVLAMRNG
jgi:methyltransferase (TIGR00027 family)